VCACVELIPWILEKGFMGIRAPQARDECGLNSHKAQHAPPPSKRALLGFLENNFP